ncbi:MAG TPA: methionyl-tRNA formyltransferase, partial [Candidatus Krumholzibacteria bacterium]|nr:methionyl-tRNA formyltransferase [Candidatus Krumholzibacteria bacterium]
RPSLVVSQPDRPRGRGQAVSPTPVRARALALGLDTVTMQRESYANGVRAVMAHAPDIIVVVAFGLILRRDLLGLPPRGCVNVHASLLPHHRGVSPIQAAILAGDAVTGCTTMLIDEGVDTGDILLREETPVQPDDTAGSLSARLAGMGARLLVRTLDGLCDGSVNAVAQDHARATTTKKVRKSHGLIDWSRDAVSLERLVRAMSPWPSAFTTHRGKRLIVEEAAARDDTRGGEPGEVAASDPLVIACGSGALEIRRLRPEGRRAMTPREYAAGHPLAAGDRFGADQR